MKTYTITLPEQLIEYFRKKAIDYNYTYGDEIEADRFKTMNTENLIRESLEEASSSYLKYTKDLEKIKKG